MCNLTELKSEKMNTDDMSHQNYVGKNQDQRHSAKSSKTPQQKFIKVTFDCTQARDLELFNKLEEFCSSDGKVPGSLKIKSSELLKQSIELITWDFVKKIQRDSMTDEDRLNFWTSSYNQKFQTILSPVEFAVRVLPTLKNKDIQALEEQSLG